LSRFEIVLSLILIAVLMSLLLNRLAEVHEAAQSARLQAAMAGVRAAAAVFHARCQANSAAPDCSTLTVDGGPVRGAFGWPAASADGIGAAAGLSGRAGRLDVPQLREGRHGGLPALFVGFGPHCEFVYVQAPSPDGVPGVDVVDATCH
jgi:hypothetical protein